MNYEIVNLKKKTIAGFSARTNNSSPDMGKVIGGLWQKLYSPEIFPKIKNRVNEKALGIYTDYADDEKSDYTAAAMFEISGDSSADLPEGVEIRKIPAGKYAKFIIKGNQITAVQEFWQELWSMDLNRAFVCDFEEYQNSDPENTEIHIYIGLKNESEKVNVYEKCPEFENEKFLIRRTVKSDRDDLLKVYSDERAVPFFNGDNCHGDNFHYTTAERMEQALDFWEQAYQNGWFVRFTVISKADNSAVGTTELFRRNSDNGGTGIFRLDLRSDYEKEEDISSILSLIIPPSFDLFGCENILTKGFPEASERLSALEKYGFVKSAEKLIGEDGTEYSDYYCIQNQKG